MSQLYKTLMANGICIFPVKENVVVKKIATPDNPEINLAAEGEKEDRSWIKFSNYDEAIQFAAEYINYNGIIPVETRVETAVAEEIATDEKECIVTLGYRIKNGSTKIADLGIIKATSEEEAQNTAEQLALAWFKNRPDIYGLVQPEKNRDNYEVKVRPN